jgi:serine/threonine protein kinase
MEIHIQPGQLVEKRYRFEHPIGFGAYGHVWKAWHEELDIPLAIKVVDVSQLDPMNLARVKQECQIGGKLADKTSVVLVRDALQVGDDLLIVMDLMPGGNLDGYLRDHRVEFPVALSWSLDLCDALEKVHAEGIIHRDIKPQNILLTDDGRVKLTDFGVAHVEQSQITTAYQPGTPGYRAPELEQGQSPDAAADIYSLCAVFFKLWTAKEFAPFKHLAEVVRQEFLDCLAHDYPEVSEDCRAALSEAILGGLAPKETRATLNQMRAALLKVKARLEARGPTLEARLAKARAVVAEDVKPEAEVPTVVSSLIQPAVAGRSAPRGQTALVDWLADEFGDWFIKRHDNEVVLWFDPDREWAPLLPLLSVHLPLIVDEGSLLEVRYRLEKRPPGQKAVVYVPRHRDQADYLKPYEFIGKCFQSSLYDFLREHGAPLPEEGHEKRAIKMLLPQLAKASVGKGEAFWQQATSVAKATSLLLPDFQGRLFAFLANPEPAWQDMQREGIAELLVDEVARRYGYEAVRQDPLRCAQRLLAHWCMVDVYVEAGQPADFPLISALPPSLYFAPCQSALRAFRYDSRYRDVFASRAQELESQYPGLVEWATLPAPLEDPPLPTLALHAWQQMMDRVTDWSSMEEVTTDLSAAGPRIRQALGADEALAEADKLASASQFLDAYADRWWRVDRAYRHYRMKVSSSGEYDALTQWVNRFYERFLDRVNVRWTATLTAVKSWPPSDGLAEQWGAWIRVRQSSGRRAVFFVDALRYELASELADELKEYTVEQEGWIASAPSVTPVGMSALLPGAKELQVEWGDGWLITIPDSSDNLADKSGRVAWLNSHLPDAVFLQLHELLAPGTTSIPPDTSWLIIFATELDAWGENAGELSLDAFSGLVQRLAQGVKKAIKIGFNEVHILTDHGFLLLGQVADHGKVDIGHVDALKANHRYLLGRNLPETDDYLRLPVRGSKDLTCYFPHGIACFKVKGRYNYVHGGLSLQEVVIPHLQARRDIERRPVGVEIQVDERIYSGIFKVVLMPVKIDMFSAEREVRLSIQRADGQVVRSTDEIVGVDEAVIKNLKLTPYDGISLGDTIYLIAQDAKTGEHLDKKAIQVQVDLEL